jgi:hypothetical protein
MSIVQIRLLELTGLKLIGRNYYQFDHKIDLERYRLTLFPGFLTNVNIYDGSLMINVDLSHKVSACEQLKRITEGQRSWFRC